MFQFNIREFLGLNFYESDLDLYLKNFDEETPQLSCSQSNEVNKYKRIFLLRDKAIPQEKKKTFWDKF